MHELTVATGVLRAVEGELSRRPGAGPFVLVIRVGALSGVDAGSLESCLELAREGTALADVPLRLERVPARLSCPRCGDVEAAAGFALACPRCGARILEVAGGRELEVFLQTEVEDEDRPDEAGPPGE